MSMPVIPALGGRGQGECSRLEATLGYRMRPCQRTKGREEHPELALVTVTGEAEEEKEHESDARL